MIEIYDDPTFHGPPAGLSQIYARRFQPDFGPCNGHIIDMLFQDDRPSGGSFTCIAMRMDGPVNSVLDLKGIQIGHIVTAATVGAGEEIDLLGFPGLGDEA
jgi:hypothetical protein